MPCADVASGLGPHGMGLVAPAGVANVGPIRRCCRTARTRRCRWIQPLATCSQLRSSCPTSPAGLVGPNRQTSRVCLTESGSVRREVPLSRLESRASMNSSDFVGTDWLTRPPASTKYVAVAIGACGGRPCRLLYLCHVRSNSAAERGACRGVRRGRRAMHRHARPERSTPWTCSIGGCRCATDTSHCVLVLTRANQRSRSLHVCRREY